MELQKYLTKQTAIAVTVVLLIMLPVIIFSAKQKTQTQQQAQTVGTQVIQQPNDLNKRIQDEITREQSEIARETAETTKENQETQREKSCSTGNCTLAAPQVTLPPVVNSVASLQPDQQITGFHMDKDSSPNCVKFQPILKFPQTGSVTYTADNNTNPQVQNISSGNNSFRYCWNGSSGNHNFKATPHSDRDGRGRQGEPRTLKIIIGNGNNIKGKNCGEKGPDIAVIGNNNTIQGSIELLIGNNNKIYGNVDGIIGNNNTIFGTVKSTIGIGNSVKGGNTCPSPTPTPAACTTCSSLGGVCKSSCDSNTETNHGTMDCSVNLEQSCCAPNSR